MIKRMNEKMCEIRRNIDDYEKIYKIVACAVWVLAEKIF